MPKYVYNLNMKYSCVPFLGRVGGCTRKLTYATQSNSSPEAGKYFIPAFADTSSPEEEHDTVDKLGRINKDLEGQSGCDR